MHLGLSGGDTVLRGTKVGKPALTERLYRPAAGALNWDPGGSSTAGR